MFFIVFFKVFFLKLVFVCLCVFYFKKEFGFMIWIFVMCLVCFNFLMFVVLVVYWGVGV